MVAVDASVLVVEDESIVALDIRARLASLGMTVVGIARDGKSAIEIAREKRPDVILMDIQIAGDIDGIETAAYIGETLDIPSVFLTAYSDGENLERAKRAGGYGYLLKPFQERELVIAVEMALFKHGAERETRVNRAILDTTLNSIEEGVITTATDGTVILINAAAQSITGWAGESALGKPIEEILNEEPLTVPDDEDRKDAPFGNSVIVRLDGTRFPAEVTRAPIGEKDGHRGNTVIVVRDVTSLLEYEHSLIEARRAAESAATMKNEFMARMSHEFRTPLNTIMGMTRLVRDSIEESENRTNLDISLSSAGEMMRLVTSLLDYSAHTPEKRLLTEEPFHLDHLMESLGERHKREFTRRGIRFAIVTGPDLPVHVHADRRGLCEVLDQLVTNAAKFTTAGSVVLTVTLSEGILDAAVQDTGPGIPAESMEDVFSEFTQLEEYRTRTAGGTGVGLAIARRIARGMGGDVTIASVLGSGTTATCRIPVKTDIPLPEAEQDAFRMRWTNIDCPLATSDSLVRRVLEPWIAGTGPVPADPERDSLPPNAVTIPDLNPATLGTVVSYVEGCVTGESTEREDKEPSGGGNIHSLLYPLRDFLQDGRVQDALDFIRSSREVACDPGYEEVLFRISLALRKEDLPGARLLLEKALKHDSD